MAAIVPIKIDAKGKRWVEMEFVTPGTPEQVWQAMAGEGNAVCFMPMTIEGKVGGVMSIDFGQGNSSVARVVYRCIYFMMRCCRSIGVAI